ncbi:DUF4230 domain-containing protein [Clostridium lundense]|uniref:DUF4230 domain-containing protein n=1 Tax=Clostridium lundense TaxID=319475 RepID=UPI0004835780|nr:DUF4230 domain-containing protein [Clostridium lundense]
MNKIIRKRTLIIIAISLILGFSLCYKYFISSRTNSLPGMTKNIEKMSRKAITSEAIVNKIRQKTDLITMEVDLSDKVVLDDSWGNFDIFKKITYINFSGKGIYTVDLSKLKAENITIESKVNTISINVPKPEVKSVNIEEEKTTYEMDKGVFRFGDIKLTPAENQILTKKVKERMEEKLKEPTMLSTALANTEKSMKELVKTALDNKSSNYNIIVYFQK